MTYDIELPRNGADASAYQIEVPRHVTGLHGELFHELPPRPELDRELGADALELLKTITLPGMDDNEK